MENFTRQFTLAAAIALVSLLEAISIAKALGEKHGDRIDPSIEIQGEVFYVAPKQSEKTLCQLTISHFVAESAAWVRLSWKMTSFS